MFDTTTDAGKNWRPTPPAPLSIASSSSLTPTVLAAVGSATAWWVVAQTSDGSRLARTIDAGQTWTTAAPRGLPAAPDSLFALGSSVAFASVPTGSGTAAYTRTVFETTDGGLDWASVR
jgi:photosystem II stability/assembly factor-like uncharacterized protein